MANLTNKKSFVHRAFRKASEEPDVQIKREIKKLKRIIKLDLNIKIGTGNGR